MMPFRRFPGAAKQKMLHRFFMRVAAENHNKASNYILELLQLGVHGLFSVHDSKDGQQPEDQIAVIAFEHELQNFISKNVQKSRLLFLTKQMMVSWIDL